MNGLLWSRRSRWRRTFRSAGTALLVAGLLAVPASTEAGKKNRRAREVQRRDLASAGIRGKQRKAKRILRRSEIFQPRRAPEIRASLTLFTGAGRVAQGETLTVTVRLSAASADARHASFGIDTNPALLAYRGFAPTGRGALLVEASPDRPGELSVYRSSLPEGFAQVEEIVSLQFDVLASGHSAIMLSDVRLMDGNARDLKIGFEAGEVYID
jgi:hypothetical protein